MRILFSVALVTVLALAWGPALAQDGGAMGQLEDATSGNQTLTQTYGDLSPSETCPEACPDGGDTNVPEPSPPEPVDSEDGG
jgi:hypothetical protein